MRPVHDGLHVILGDVTGKGARASLVMAGTQACADALVEQRLDPRELVELLDAWAVRNTPEMCFVTLWCGRIDVEGHVRFVDAGHGLALIQRADGTVEYPEQGRRPPIGIEPLPCELIETTLDPGDALILFSDGFLIEEPTDNGRVIDTPDRVKDTVEPRRGRPSGDPRCPRPVGRPRSIRG